MCWFMFKLENNKRTRDKNCLDWRTLYESGIAVSLLHKEYQTGVLIPE